jgi:Non-ribosomal peptide synthetase modules and related proteins
MNLENIEDLYELSPLQQGMLFDNLLTPESGVYVAQLNFLLKGRLNVAAFERAWQQVVNLNTVLRTSFSWEHTDKPLQMVHKRVDVPINVQDWRAMPRTDQKQKMEAYLREDRLKGFKLSQAPLMRLTLVRLADEEYEFTWSHHHLILDGWSVYLVFKELFQYYEAYCRGERIDLKPSRPYGDYMGWLQSRETAEAEAFWRATLGGFTTPTRLSIDDGPASNAATGDYDNQRFNLSEGATASLQRFARQHKLTLNTVVQGVWSILLSRYSGSEDVVYGVVVSGRPTELGGVESMVGLFINTLPVRVQVPGDQVVSQWLRQLQSRQAEMRQYEYNSLVEIQGWSDVPRGEPLFEMIFVFENYRADGVATGRTGEP